jgi:hypothetical protein
MVGLVILAAIVTAVLWVNGIHHMNKNYPDYKAEDFFNEDEDLKDWDVTLTDGLEEEDESNISR